MKLIILTSVIILSAFTVSSGQVVQDYLTSDEISISVEATKSEGKRLWNLQNHAVQYSFIGEYRAALETQRLFQNLNKAAINAVKGHQPDLDLLNRFKAVNAVDAIKNAANNHQVVITNEAHYQPQNRVFTTALLVSLYKQGFRYFAAEDLSINDKIYKKSADNELNKRKYPIRKTGYYMMEPQYGNLIRTALRIGYKLVPYDDFASEIKDPLKRAFAREKGQARNIASVIANDPKARILVHSGYGHLNEHINDDGLGLMGAMLKKNHGIDPLTVDQITYLPEKKSAYYQKLKLKTPSVLVDSKNQFFAPEDETIKSDMKVFFPETKYSKGRPNWLFYPRGRQFFRPSIDRTKLEYPVLLMAYVENEPKNTAIPVDVIELSDASDDKHLVLEKGDYDLVIMKNGKAIEMGPICIK